MADSAKLKRFIQLKIFGGRLGDVIDRELEKLEEKDLSRPEGCRKESAYVEVFEDMVKTVWDSQESHLLTEKEWLPFNAYRNLSYNCRYCLVRLLLLKPDHWYSLASFEKWKREVGREGIIPSMGPLCRPVKEFLSLESAPVNLEEQDAKEDTGIIDLTFDSDDEDVKPSLESLNNAAPVAGPSRLQEPRTDLDPFERVIQSKPDDANLEYFCEDESAMSIEELLNRLTVENLKQLAKQNKSAPNTPRPKKLDYITSLLKNSTTQSVLGFTSGKAKGKAPDSLRQTQLPFALKIKQSIQQRLAFPKIPKNSQQDRLRKQTLAILGKCYRLNYDFFKVVRRIHIISFRCTEHPPKLMIPALLTTFKKRTYPEYTPQRDPDIWPSRHDLLDYEKALELEALVDEILGAEVPSNGTASTVDRRFVTPVTSISAGALTTPLRTPRNVSKLEEVDEDFIVEEQEIVDPPPETPQLQKAKRIVHYLDTWLLYSWKFHLELKSKNSGRPPSLQRFESGYVYTRLLRKSLQSLAATKDYGKELEIIETLLSQTAWQRGKRAKLYERRAILQTRYLCQTEGLGRNNGVLKQALEGVRQALQDDDTHLVARPSLLRRLRRLEKQLKVPPEECARCEGELRKADVVVIRAKRIQYRASSLKVDPAGNVIKDKENTTTNLSVDTYFTRTGNPETPLKMSDNQADHRTVCQTTWRRKGKSVWEGRGRQDVNVEGRALQYYEDMGYKGFHAETSIMTTIWILLNWDIVYADIRGAFETAYQSAPLDIVDDSFYHSRKEMFDARMEEIREGKAADIITRHDIKHRPNNTWAIGVRWDICELRDLIEIVECLGGPSLATICRLFCEDYVGRSSGAPDLIVWNHEKRICKFVEVKGPGDTPQENQKLWFDSLLGAGVHVEICKVVDMNDVKTETSTRKGKSKTPASSVPSKRKRNPTFSGRGTYSESESDDDRDYDKLDRKSGDELPQAACPSSVKRQRISNPGP